MIGPNLEILLSQIYFKINPRFRVNLWFRLPSDPSSLLEFTASPRDGNFGQIAPEGAQLETLDTCLHMDRVIYNIGY